ncbi:hypothetical protein [Prosthecobacter sp.]|uniref:hypothetical protein n=1 Tax=Prosthecobacter sp. TaxID=1965333 RepID=UPI003904C6C3
MQVSWIDADRIKTLVAQIVPQEPSEDGVPQAVEIETVPDAVSMSAVESWGTAMDWMEPVTAPVPATEAMKTEPAEAQQTQKELEEPTEMLAESREDEAEGDGEHGMPLHNPAAALPLSRIRDKLRAIRQRATAAGILTRVSDAVVPSPEPVAESEVAAAVSDAVEAPANEPMETPAVLESVVSLPQTPAIEIPQGSRDQRLAAFADWARLVLHEDGGHMLVMSDEGEVLWGGEAKAGLVLSTMMAWGAAIRASASSAGEAPPVIRQPLASGNVLTVIPCETDNGVIHAAVTAPAGLSDELALVLRRALCAATA